MLQADVAQRVRRRDQEVVMVVVVRAVEFVGLLDQLLVDLQHVVGHVER